MTHEPKLTPDQLDELWKQTVHNKAHRILHDAQDLHNAFNALVDAAMLYPSDRISLIERDISLVQSHCSRLVHDMTKATLLVNLYRDRLKEEKKKEEDEKDK